MEEKIKAYIIPNDEYYDKCGVFSKDDVEKHIEVYQDFSDQNNLGYHFSEEDYHNASVQIALDGHFSAKVVENLSFITFIPKVVTDRQLDWFISNKDQYKDYPFIGGYSLEGDTVLDTEEVYGMENLEKIIKERNEDYKGKMVM